MMEDRRTHRNGFFWPFSCHQALSYIAVTFLVAVYYALVQPNLSQPLYGLCLGVHSMACGGLLVCGFVSTYIDPSDLTVKRVRGQLSNSPETNFRDFPKLCVRCKTRVGVKSKHCSVCDRCTADFDHHCTWLNNCVGSRNYHWFVALISALQCVCAVQVCAQVALLVQICREGLQDSALMLKYSIGENGFLFFLTLSLAWLLDTTCFVSNGFLIVFHFYLWVRSMTTYEFVAAVRKRKPKVVPLRYDIEITNKDSPNGVQPSNWTSQKDTTDKSASFDSSHLQLHSLLPSDRKNPSLQVS